MKRPTMLVKAIFAQAKLDLDLSVERDVATLQRRCKHEGESFLTITLPTLSDALEQGLESGRFSCPSHFARHGSLPRFLGGFFKRVFTLDGRLLDEPCPYVVFYIRQICRFFKKIQKECSPSRNLKATQHFIDVEGELRMMTSQMERKDIFLDQVSGIIWSQVFPEIDPLDLVCHHGPGVTADRLLSNGRNRIRSWNQRSEFLFPSDLHCYPNYGVAAQFSDIGNKDVGEKGPNFLEIRDELPVRVVFVPKTQTAPRVIAIEPSHMQYMQQSVKDYVYKVLESHSLTRRSIRFKRQDVNQRLAYYGSIDKRTATLDLKDASDRVHLALVQRIFKNSGLLEYLEDARSLHAVLPNGRNIVLSKYASMGSALCFPVEAMVFYTLIQSAMHQLDGRRPSSSSIKHYSAMIDIYGDDIVVPVEYADAVVKNLELYALKVNVNKSFKEGNFRESCGMDFFKGVPVNPVYARREPYDDLRRWNAEDVMSWTATANLFYMRGMWIVAQAIRDLLCRVVRRTIPSTRVIGPGVAFFSFVNSTDLRYNARLHCYEQKRLHYYPIKRKDNIDGDELACLNKWGQSNYASSRHYTSAGSNTDGRGHRDQHLLGWYRDSESYSGGGTSSLSGMDRLDGSHQRSVVGHQDDDPGPNECADGVLQIPQPYGLSPEEILGLRPMGGSGAAIRSLCLGGESSTRPGFDFSADYCLTEEVASDPLSYLQKRSTGIDFLTSTKRGCFKSNSRWVSLAG